MQSFIVFSVVCAFVTALPYPEIIEDENGEQYQLVPLVRHRKQNQKTSFDIQSPGIATVTHTGTFINNDIHRLDGTGYAAKDLRGHGIKPDAYGGNLDYLHKPSGSVLGVGADHARRGGTDVTASGTWNFVHTKNADMGLTGQYGRHFGAGGSQPNYGVFLGGKVRF